MAKKSAKSRHRCTPGAQLAVLLSLPVARGALEHTVDVTAPPDAVAAFLAGLTNYEAIHPMLVNVRAVPGRSDA